MFVSMKRGEFDAMEPEVLAKVCIDPILQRIRAKSASFKAQVYAELTAGQKAMMMFRVLHDHTGQDAGTFYVWVSQLLAEPKTWNAVKTGMSHLGEDELLDVLEGMETACADRGVARSDDLAEDPRLRAAVQPLHDSFRTISKQAWNRFGQLVRSRPTEFVQFAD